MFKEKRNQDKVCISCDVQYTDFWIFGCEWHQILRNKLCEIGLKCSDVDPCLFSGFIDNFDVYLAVYIDDVMIISKYLCSLHKIKKELSNTFKMKDLVPTNE